MKESNPTLRSVARIVDSIRTVEGGGFIVRRPFPTPALDHFDPFLLLDELGPVNYGPGEPVGAPDHPHRGFETVSYILDGALQHRDSAGNAGRLGPGDVQWMTAGAGVVHSEMPAEEFAKRGGRSHAFQIWVNLPRRDKMMKPRYQDVPAESIPVARSGDGKVKVKVIAGEALGVRAVIDTRTPILYHHVTAEKGGRVVLPVPADFNVFAYVIDGEGLFGASSTRARSGQMIIFSGEGGVSIANESEKPLDLLLIGGVPLREPVARYGPFVMNTPNEIIQAFEDYSAGRMGQIG